MPNAEFATFKALDPLFKIVMEGLRGLVDGEHYFDTFVADAVFESRYHFPGWPMIIHGRANLMAALSAYGNSIYLHGGDRLVTHRIRSTRKGSRDRCALRQQVHLNHHD